MSDRTKEEARQIALRQTAHVLIVVLLIVSYCKVEKKCENHSSKKKFNLCTNFTSVKCI